MGITLSKILNITKTQFERGYLGNYGLIIFFEEGIQQKRISTLSISVFVAIYRKSNIVVADLKI